MVKSLTIDFSKIPDSGGRFNKKRQPAGDYKAVVTKVEDAPSKKDGTDQWLFTIKVGSGTYPYYCKHTPDQFWKIKTLLQAAGITVPPKRANVNPDKLVGKTVGVTLQDTEYNDRLQSEIASVLPVSEIVSPNSEEATDDDEEVEEDDTVPTPTSVDDDELEELEVEEL